ncbi:DUF4435 domain-containing protein [Desertifilum sp. FACHB-1129]|uniref:Uncharacterized protein n=1 Tax=Desertifilum tharense IPPAS B-1220 TaxID=1781255 RepID=A0A1E5QNT2_9CYAN|nr:DUF4435 domain-containing protein [Desertifilum tharense]MBD2311635.1 DUF4435 domain-containing protein [Desertifilum sp. FACHB-1129]MBD2322840.1 DUF4435 domain-containing protein [Desertifilum sp. FACHB-866]MBD2332766.1 DUF4435 domain-containing protein [Desertifilum sp. FACHB-868]MDA0209361.1 DUF4435 domain-containing protein [Cyanobacteria bacterium FC1]OEJ76325.1 hypothetical protein BH720_04770 [Desertifilum tharense IPPAS B-1220]
MSVVSSGKVIFCEGTQRSLDIQLLERVLEEIPTERPTIVSSGSKFTFSIFAQGYFFPNETPREGYLVFRDRDFDAKPPDSAQLIQLSNQRIWLTYRACVENYLIDAELIDTYWREQYTEKQENPISKWGHGNSPGIEDIAQWIEASARSLQAYQAVRWALGDLLHLSAARSQLKTTWTAGSGKLPSSLLLPDCQTEALRLVEEFRSATNTVTPERFADSLAGYQQQFTADLFWQQQQYLIWFHGKDIQKQMQIEQSRYISLDSFFKWAVKRVNISQHPDLVELQEKIEQL